MDNILYFLVGLVLGFILMKVFSKKSKPMASSGYLRVDHSDPDSPYLFLEISSQAEMDQIPKKKQICFDVKTEDFVPQK